MKKSGGKTPRFGSSFSKKRSANSIINTRDGGSVYVRDNESRLSQARKGKPQAVQRDKKLGEAVIERFAHDGRGITQLDGKTVFVSGALAGERVSLRLVDEQPRFIEARADVILDAASARQTPPCPHFARCGGCDLQHIAPATQLSIKQQAVLDQVRRWGNTEPRQVSEPIAAGDSHYRARARLGVWYCEDGSVAIGFREKGGKTIVAIDSCYVLAEGLSALIAPITQALTKIARSKNITHIEMIETARERALVLRHIKPLSLRDGEVLGEFAAAQKVSVWLDDGSSALVDLAGAPVTEALHLALPAQQLELKFYPADFTQVNPAINHKMIARALELLALKPTDKVVDLFCGMGNFTLPIAKQVAQVTGVEGAQAMVERARANALHNGISNADFITANLATDDSPKLRQLCAPADVLVLDPPRDGARELVSQLRDLAKRGRLAARSLLYVSCNPATLARDTAILVEAGFVLADLGALDMFPHTAHVESIALFTRS